MKNGGGRVLCSNCITKEALKDFSSDVRASRIRQAEKQVHSERMRIRRSRSRTAMLWATLALCAVIISVQGVRIYHANLPPKPVRTGIQDTDAITDQCIHNLWVASSALSRNQEPPAGLLCPASHAAYIVETQGNDTVVRCPNPEHHGLSALRVSRTHPVPEAIR